MPKVGILAGKEEEGQRLKDCLEVLFAGQRLSGEIRLIGKEETEDIEDCAFLVLAFESREIAFRLAERIWKREERILIIYVSYQVEDIFAALQMPFFHTVRSYDLEQDWKAVIRKMEGIKMPCLERVSFSKSGQTLLFPKREILYLESGNHTVKVWLEHGFFTVTETLTDCERKLKKRDFIRIDRSVLVNMYHIRSLDREKVVLSNGNQLYVSRRRYPEVKIRFDHYIRHLHFI